MVSVVRAVRASVVTGSVASADYPPAPVVQSAAKNFAGGFVGSPSEARRSLFFSSREAMTDSSTPPIEFGRERTVRERLNDYLFKFVVGVVVAYLIGAFTMYDIWSADYEKENGLLSAAFGHRELIFKAMLWPYWLLCG